MIRLIRSALIMPAALAGVAVPADASPPPLLNRLVRHFDFEDAAERPVALPLNIHRVGGSGGEEGEASRGFPRWGTIALSDAHACTGQSSLGFDLQGGSLAARITAGAIPALPESDYRVSVRVRTDGLVHAAAQLVAWRYDREGEPIPESRRASEPVRTGGRWQTLTVHLDGHYGDAVDLGVDLQIVQPRQLGPLAKNVPLPEDFSGSAWFDDLTIWHLPRIRVTPTEATGVFIAPQTPALVVGVQDLIDSAPNAKLEIVDAEGRLVCRERVTSGPARRMELPGLAYGWYRASVHVRCDRGVETASTRDFVVLPPAAVPTPGFGVEIDTPGVHTAPLVEDIGAGMVLVGAAIAGGDVVTGLETIERLGADLAVVLDERLEGTDLLIEYGQLVDLWQLGTTEPGPLSHAQRVAALDTVRARLHRVVPGAPIVVPWPVEQPLERVPGAAGLHLVIPAALAPETMLELAAEWQGGDLPRLASFRLLPPEVYPPAARVNDLLLRTVYGWRAGLPRMLIAAPWRHVPDPAPDPTFVAWHQVAQRLSGRRFLGAMDLGDDVEAWLAAPIDETAGSFTLIAWAPANGPGVETTASAYLGDSAVTIVDAFGNREPVALTGGEHVLPLTSTPVFVEGVDGSIARFRAAFGVDPPLIASEHRRHRHEVHLSNPWRVPITGSVALRPTDPAVEVSPRILRFEISAGDTVRLPIEFVPGRSVVAGPVGLEGDFEIDASRADRFGARAAMEIGLDGLRLATGWSPDPSGVAIVVEVTNTGDVARTLEAFLHTPGIGRHRRGVGRLAPGETAIRRFTLTDAATLRGSTVYAGVDEPATGGRLMKSVEVPHEDTTMEIVQEDTSG